MYLHSLLLAVALVVGPGQQNMDRLLVTGNGFVFGVKEPSGWHGDTGTAGAIGASILFTRKGESLDEFSALVYVRVNRKTDEDLAADLDADMNGYKRQHADAQFRDFVASHPTYAVFPKLFVVPGKSFEYVAYVNPGKDKRLMFSVTMHVPRREATAEELAAYREVLASLAMLQP